MILLQIYVVSCKGCTHFTTVVLNSAKNKCNQFLYIQIKLETFTHESGTRARQVASVVYSRQFSFLALTASSQAGTSQPSERFLGRDPPHFDKHTVIVQNTSIDKMDEQIG